MTARVTRAVGATVAGVALATAVIGFLPGREVTWGDGGRSTYAAGGIPVVIFALAIALPAALAVRWPDTWAIWTWCGAGWIASAGYYLLAFESYKDETLLWPSHVVHAGTAALALGSMFGAPLLAFARMSAGAPVEPAHPARARRLRRFVVGIVAVAVAIVIVGFLPGDRVYDDANNCLGSVLSAHGHSECTSSYTEVSATHPAGGPIVALYLVLLLSPAIVVRADPRRGRAWLWTSWAAVGLLLAGGVLLVLEFRIDVFQRTEVLWARRVVEVGVVGIPLLILIVVPAIVLATSDRSELPAARVRT